MAQAQHGDMNAYRALLDDIGPMVMAFLRRRVRQAEDAEDVYQEIFMALHRTRGVYQPAHPLEPWLFAIAQRVLRAYLRRRLARVSRELLVEDPLEMPVDSDCHLRLQLEQAIRCLTADQQRAVELLKINGLSAETAAREAGTTTGAVKVRAHRGYKVLRHLL